jgi:hypothetical protein
VIASSLRIAAMLHGANHRAPAPKRTRHTLAGNAGLTPSFPNRWLELEQILALALSDDPDVSAMACMELRSRLDRQEAAAS